MVFMRAAQRPHQQELVAVRAVLVQDYREQAARADVAPAAEQVRTNGLVGKLAYMTAARDASDHHTLGCDTGLAV